MKKNCLICGLEYDDSKIAILGESEFCIICRQIKDKKALHAIRSLAKQIENISKNIVHFHKKEIKELKNEK